MRKGQFLKFFLYVTTVKFVLKMAEAGSSRVTLAGGASFVKVNGKDWEKEQSIRALGTNVAYYTTYFALPPNLSVNLYKRRTTSESNSRTAIFSTKFTEVTYKKGFKNCPYARHWSLIRTGHQVNRG